MPGREMASYSLTARPATVVPRVCELVNRAPDAEPGPPPVSGTNASPVIRTATVVPPAVRCRVSPTDRLAVAGSAVLTTAWPGPWYQVPLTMSQPRPAVLPR